MTALPGSKMRSRNRSYRIVLGRRIEEVHKKRVNGRKINNKITHILNANCRCLHGKYPRKNTHFLLKEINFWLIDKKFLYYSNGMGKQKLPLNFKCKGKLFIKS
jgi:hypothetical protein